MHEIKIYGEIVPFEDNWIIEQGGYSNLTHLQQQLKEANGSDVKVRINSCGGDVDTGFAMYAELRRYAKDNNAKVVTFGEARVQSIATVFFLAGDERILTEHTEPFVHNAWTYAMGDSKQIQRIAVELENCNSKIAQHYANHTDLTYDEALDLMNNETSISTEEAKNMRFATSIEEVFRPAALKRFNNNKLDTDMNKNPKTKGALAKAIAFLTTGFNSIVNKVVMTADEKELDFYELEEDEVIEVGASARVDGIDANGDYVMKSGETYVFVDGQLTEIKEASTEEPTSEDAVALQAEIDTLTAKLEEVTTKASAEIETLRAEASKKDTIIANYKNIVSASAPKDGGKQKEKETKEASTASKAIGSFVNNNLLKK